MPPKEKARGAAVAAAREEALRDYRTAYLSRQVSLVGRAEVFAGKAKFGIFGDGKEVAQVAMARAFRAGDFRSGYYRDQTFMFALGMLSVEQFFAQLYAHADAEAEPCSAGRSMTAHFATRTIDAAGDFRDLASSLNSSADVSPTGSQMPRLVGLAQASRLFRNLESLHGLTHLSRRGNEIAWGTIGNASCAEGLFWEAINAAGVLQVPMLLSIWDDGYGISVPNEHQVTGGDLERLLSGFRRDAKGRTSGFDLYQVHGWDYPALIETYRQAAATVRREHVPAIVHVDELTQPQGHSTSGSHERYKDAARLAWEAEHDCLERMRAWVLAQELATASELDRMEAEDRELATALKDRAWEAYTAPIRRERDRLVQAIGQAAGGAPAAAAPLEAVAAELRRKQNPLRRELSRAALDALLALPPDEPGRIAGRAIHEFSRTHEAQNAERYSSHLYCESAGSALRVPEIAPVFAADAPKLRGFEILNACFDAALARIPQLVALGEDVGKLGDVNQGFSGLQEKYGELRVADAGIREATILGQGIGMALRGLRPIVEIQYLDYILYALQIMSDDLATLTYRTRGGQKAPVIVRTRGHRLEGIWHSGSPMAGIIHLVRGMCVLVPRDMTRAAGFYNTMLRADDSAVIVEVLNGYRLRERLPSNIGEFTLPLGVPEVLRPGGDVTLATYGACCRIAAEAADVLAGLGIEVELIDVQTLLPFDVRGRIAASVRKTSRLVCLDEDVPGGATAFMLREVLEVQGAYRWLDSAPVTISAKPHRPAYGSDGDYWSKPNREQIVRAVYALLREADPRRYPARFE